MDAPARPRLVEDEPAASPTKEEMARMIESYQDTIKKKNRAIAFYCREIDDINSKFLSFRKSNIDLKEALERSEEKNEFWNSMAIDMQKRSAAMEAERSLWSSRHKAMTEEKNRAVMDREHWKREAQRHMAKLDMLLNSSSTRCRVKYDDGKSGPSAEDAIKFELEMEAILDEDYVIDEVGEMIAKMNG